MYNTNNVKSNAAQQIGTIINLLGVIGFIVILIVMDTEFKLLFAFITLISNIALGTILMTLGNIQELLELETIEVEED